MFWKFCSKGPSLSTAVQCMNICAIYSYQNLGPSVYLVLNQTPETEFWVEQKKDSFITLQAKGDTPCFCLKKKLNLNPSELDMVYSSGSKVRSLIRLGYKWVLHSLVSFQVGSLLNLNELSAPFIFSSGDFLAAPLLISYCSNLPLETQGKVKQWRNLTYEKWGTARPPCLCGALHTAPVSHIWLCQRGAGSEERLEHMNSRRRNKQCIISNLQTAITFFLFPPFI